MAKLVTLMIVIMLPLLMRSQVQNVPSVPLRTLDDRTVVSADIIRQGQITLVYYFDFKSKDVMDHFTYIENLKEKYKSRDDVTIIAVINTTNYNQVKPYLDGNSIVLETYVDINGEFLQTMGLPAYSAYFLFGPDMNFTYYYPESLNFDSDIIHIQNYPLAYNQEQFPGDF